jgi:hypothetical protein
MRENAMREDVVTPATARRLAAAGLIWEPQIGDWCAILGGEHIGEGHVGLWLVAAIFPATAMLGLVDSAGKWPAAQAPARDCLWLPTAGKLKAWLRSQGYRVATGESPALLLGGTSATTRHVCRLTRADDTAPLDGEGFSESEALADVVLRILGAQTADAPSSRW